MHIDTVLAIPDGGHPTPTPHHCEPQKKATPCQQRTAGISSVSVEHHRVQSTGNMDNEPESSRGVPYKGLPSKTDQFRHDPTHSCAPGRRCDRVSSVSLPRTRKAVWSGVISVLTSHLEGGVIGCHQCLYHAHGKYSGICKHATYPSWLWPSYLPSTTSIPAPTQPTTAKTNYTHAPTVTNSSAFTEQF